MWEAQPTILSQVVAKTGTVLNLIPTVGIGDYANVGLRREPRDYRDTPVTFSRATISALRITATVVDSGPDDV